MILYGDLHESIIRDVNGGKNPTLISAVGRRINMKLQYIAAKDSWADLREKLEITYDNDPVQLPSNLLGIDLVWDDTNEIEFFERNRAASEAMEMAFRYYTYPVGSSLAEVSDVAINQDGTTFDSADLLALDLTTDDEWFYVEGDTQLYQISENTDSLYTFSPAYRGNANLTSAKIVVRPKNTLMLQLISAEGYSLSTGTIDLHYWRQPDTLRDPSDIIPLPTVEVLEYSVLASMPEAKRNRPISQNQVIEALQEAMGMNPDKPQPRLARGINGRVIDFSVNHYAARNGEVYPANGVQYRWQMNRT